MEYGSDSQLENILDLIIDVSQSSYDSLTLVDTGYEEEPLNDLHFPITTQRVSHRNALDGEFDIKETPYSFFQATLRASLSGKEKDFLFQYRVMDTQVPVLYGAMDMKMVQGTELDFKKLIRAQDPVDGFIPITVIEDIDFDIPEVYKVTVLAEDKHGNIAGAVFHVEVYPRSDSD